MDGDRERVTSEVRQGEGSPLVGVFPVEGLQDLGAAEPLEAALHVGVVPLQRLGPQSPEDERLDHHIR